MKAGRNYRDGLFRDYFKEPKRLLSLANALLGTSVKDENEIEINTLEGVFFGSLKNDLSCIVQNTFLCITEAQSTTNPNMPMRMLFYSAELLKEYLVKIGKKLYGSQLVKVVAPKFFVIYLGDKEKSLYSELKLSDAFVSESSLNLTVTVINICSFEADILLKNCKPLKWYITFLDKASEYEKVGLKRPDAIREAIKWAISNGIMADYLKTREAEVYNMVGFEWNEEEAREYWKKEAREIGWKEGNEVGKKEGKKEGEKEGEKRGIVISLKNLMKNMNLPLDKAMDVLQITGEDRKKYALLV